MHIHIHIHIYTYIYIYIYPWAGFEQGKLPKPVKKRTQNVDFTGDCNKATKRLGMWDEESPKKSLFPMFPMARPMVIHREYMEYMEYIPNHPDIWG